jgi:hypothetical protein
MLSVILALLLSAPALVTGVPCCIFIDNNVSAGSPTYFAEAVDSTGQTSVPSNSAVVVVPNDGKAHSVTITWTASITPNVTYTVFRVSPPVMNQPVVQ